LVVQKEFLVLPVKVGLYTKNHQLAWSIKVFNYIFGMKYQFDGSDEIRTCEIDPVGDIAQKVLQNLFGTNPPCKFELLRLENGVYIFKKTYKEIHVYEKKKIIIKKRKRRWHSKERRIRKYNKYLKD